MSKILVANQLRLGHIVSYEGDICEVMQSEFSRQGRGGSMIRLVLRSLGNHSQKVLSINVDVKFQLIDVAEEEVEYMYDDGETIFSTCGRDFPIYYVDKEILPLIPQAGFFRLLVLNDEIYKIVLPQKAKVKIQSTEPTLKGQTVNLSYKRARLYNGWTIQVPAFIEEEDEIMIDTSDLNNPTYISKP